MLTPLKIAPILLAILWGLGVYLFSARRSLKELDRKSKRLGDRRIGDLVATMARALDLEEIRVFVHETPIINGLASADGRVFITRGFLDKYHLGQVTAEELSTVVAHELGHLALGHTRKRLVDFAALNAFRVLVHVVIGRFVPFIGGYIAAFLTSLFTARLSQASEYEADRFAATLLMKSGIGTAPQKSLFQKLNALTGFGSQPPAWLASHPKPEARIAAIEALEAKWNTHV
ncbi:MAG: M48 family metalloprotease [Paracoccaceae bacterium]|nr:M48 family metalloprotease [Paracoccaceae bacterium]MDE2912608.1 M48 family metalloprotease [Paracoccaceae bacterium]